MTMLARRFLHKSPVWTLTALLTASIFCSALAAQSKQARPQPAPLPPGNACLGYAQHPDLRPDTQTERLIPTVTFRLEMPSFNPTYFGVAVESTGKAAYVSEPKATPDNAPGDPYIVKFVMSQATRQRIFELARAASYFQGDFAYTKGNIANTGAKTLSYADEGRCSQTTYNWSMNPAIQQLTAIFQGISNTLEFGRRLAFLHRFDKLGLDAELKSMEDEAARGDLTELQAVEPVLRNIFNDHGVMNLARERAARLLARIRPAQ